jgi:Leucine-rich repeat (LRR) protein
LNTLQQILTVHFNDKLPFLDYDVLNQKQNQNINDEFNSLSAQVLSSKNVLNTNYSGTQEGKCEFFSNLIGETGYVSGLDLDRCDMGSIKKTLMNFLKTCGMGEKISSLSTTPTTVNTLSSVGELLSRQGMDHSFLDTINKMPPQITDRTKFPTITSDVIQKHSGGIDFEKIVYLNLIDNSIHQIQCLEELTNLKTIKLSFNNIRKIEGLDNCEQLTILELGYNQIKKLENLQNLKSLKYLELNNNYLSKLEELGSLRQYNPYLKEITLKCNPFSQKKNYRARVLTFIPHLKKIDEISILERDKELLHLSHIQITQELIFEHSKFSDQLSNDGLFISHTNASDFTASASSYKKSLNNKAIAQAQNTHLLSSLASQQTKQVQLHNLQEDSKDSKKSQVSQYSLISSMNPHLASPDRSPGRQRVKMEDWEPRVEVLILNHQRIHKIDNLHKLTNLRRLSLIDNRIMSIEGLENCTLLEELCLEKNKIYQIQNLHHLHFLKKLDLGKNKITKLLGLNNLENITQLSLEDNEITSIKGLEYLKNLMELYIGNNLLQNLNEILYIKGLPKLIIFDISGNKVCNETNSRLYMIFHLKKLKVLDGMSIDQNEINSSKECFAGRLTQEVLDSRLIGKTTRDIIELDLSSCK